MANLDMLVKQKSPSLPKNIALRTFSELLIVFLTKVYLYKSIPPLFNGLEVLPFASSENFNLDHSDISLPGFPSRPDLK